MTILGTFNNSESPSVRLNGKLVMFDVERLDTSLITLPLAKCQGRLLQGGGIAINVTVRTIPIFVIEDAQIVAM